MVWNISSPVFLPTGGTLKVAIRWEAHDVKVAQTLLTDSALAKVAEHNIATILTHDAEL